jgi:signal transduction histidine kinase
VPLSCDGHFLVVSKAGTHMRLAEFILKNLEQILIEWESFARTLSPGCTMSVTELRDHAESILRVTARDMMSAQSEQQRSEKSKGLGGGGEESKWLDEASGQHALGRLGSGFNLVEVVSEYRALRASVLHLWRNSIDLADSHDLQDLIRFDESIDQSLAEAVKSYTTRVEESRELFLATLGHDLRAPLNALMLSADVLERSGQLNGQNAEIASRMKVFGKTMTSMIHDLLDFTRTRLGRGIPVSLESADLALVCQDVLDEFRTAHPDRRFRLALESDLRGHWDAARLRQVLSNLIANAVAHGDDDREIEILARSAGPDVIFSVTNRGPEIPESAIPTLFDPFVRGATTLPSQRRREGVGLGLFISHAIATAHGGTITAASSQSEGTVFSVRLPRKSAGAD